MNRTPLPYVKNHVLVQLGGRYGIAVSRPEIYRAYGSHMRLYTTAAGEAVGVFLDGTPVVLIVRNEQVVTALTLEQACATCPQAVFGFLVCSGRLKEALGVRCKYHERRLTMPIGGIPKFPERYAVLWNAFKWAAGSKELSC